MMDQLSWIYCDHFWQIRYIYGFHSQSSTDWIILDPMDWLIWLWFSVRVQLLFIMLVSWTFSELNSLVVSTGSSLGSFWYPTGYCLQSTVHVWKTSSDKMMNSHDAYKTIHPIGERFFLLHINLFCLLKFLFCKIFHLMIDPVERHWRQLKSIFVFLPRITLSNTWRNEVISYHITINLKQMSIIIIVHQICDSVYERNYERTF